MNEWLEIHALADDELDSRDRKRVQERIKGCEKSQAELLAIRHLKSLVADKCTGPECEDSWKSCVKRLQEIDRTKQVESFVGRYAWGICAVFFCFILGGAYLNRLGGLKAGDVAKVSASLAPLSLPRSQDSDVTTQWLQTNLDKTMRVPLDSVKLVGAATGYLPDGRRIARADLQDGQGALDLYVVQQTDRLDDVEQMDGHSQYSAGKFENKPCVAWSDHGREFILVGQRPLDALCETADALSLR